MHFVALSDAPVIPEPEREAAEDAPFLGLVVLVEQDLFVLDELEWICQRGRSEGLEEVGERLLWALPVVAGIADEKAFVLADMAEGADGADGIAGETASAGTAGKVVVVVGSNPPSVTEASVVHGHTSCFALSQPVHEMMKEIQVVLH